MLNVDVKLNKSVVDRVGPFSDKIVILFCEKKKKEWETATKNKKKYDVCIS